MSYNSESILIKERQIQYQSTIMRKASIRDLEIYIVELFFNRYVSLKKSYCELGALQIMKCVITAG